MTTAPDSAPRVRFTVPGEPMPKERPRFATTGRNGVPLARPRIYTPKETEDYEKKVRLIAYSAKPANWPMHCRYRVDLVIFRSEPRGDRDNYDKITGDAINPRRAKYKGKGANKRLVSPAEPGVLWKDDGRSYEGSQRIVDVSPREACLDVTITALAVNCVNKTCQLPTCYVDEDGRCPACHRALEEKRARRLQW